MTEPALPWARLSPLLDELFELEEAARAARLQAIEAENPALGAELRRLLAADAGASGLLDHGIAAAAPTLVSQLAQSEHEDRSLQGRQLGHYRLLERIGRGGMGEVWRAERADGDFQQQVAVKLIAPGLLGDSAEQRFARERRILARLEHPNIARLLDGGLAEGTPYYAMELVEGESLTAYAARRGLSTRARVELLLQVCDAVAYAHTRLVVHRDIKPANILVDGEGRVRVLDFGIAKLLDDSDVRITRTGVRAFSPAYAAPEQIRGEEVATSTDVYAMGAVLYELLTDSLPHPERRIASDRLLATLEAETLVKPSRRQRETIGSGGARAIDADLDTITLTALHADPQRRYPSAARLGDDLRAWLGARPIAARADTARYRMGKFVRRHRFAVGGASVALLALLVGLSVALWQAEVAREQAARADAEAERALAAAARADSEAERAIEAARKADRIKQFLSSIFTQADPLRRDPRGELTLSQAFDDAVQRIDREFEADPDIRIDLLDDFGEIRAGQGDLEGARALIERALALAEATHGPNHPSVAESSLNLGVLSTYEGRFADGEVPLRRALDILHGMPDPPVSMLAAALSGLAGVLHSTGRGDEALPLLREIVELRRTRAPDDRRMLAIDLQNLATALISRGLIDEAATRASEARAILEELHGKDSAAMVPLLWLQDEIQYHRGELAAQRETVALAVSLSKRHLPNDHWWTAHSLTSQGWVLNREGEYAAGYAALDEAQGIFDRLSSPMVVEALLRRAQSYKLQGRLREAQAELEDALERCRATQRERNPTCLATLATLAEVAGSNGDSALALGHSERALALIAEELGDHTDEYAQALLGRAIALEGSGRGEEAAALRRQRHAVLRALYGDQHPFVRSVAAAMERAD